MAFKAALLFSASATSLFMVQPAFAQVDRSTASGQPSATDPNTSLPVDQSNANGSVAAVKEQPAVDGTAPDAGSPAADADIVVTGVRGSLASAQAIKRNATQIVDSIVAEDIGKLPDNTVSDALQRVTGVQVTRGAGEATSVLIRGLPNIATVLNGREAFTGTGRGFALQDIPAELIAGVDVYKTNTPDLIEGGITGLIDVRLRRPFDFRGFQVAGSGRAVYSDQADKWGYIGSGLVSNRWETGAGEFGALVGVSYNRRRYQDQTAFDFISSGTPIATPDTVGGLYTSGDRKRLAVNTSLQWKPNPDLEFYADGIFTQYKETQAVDFFIGLPKAGTITAITPRGDAPSLAQSSTTTNAFTLTSKQAYQNKTDNYQAAIGTKWTPGQAILSTELTYNYSKLPNRNVITDTSFNTPSLVIDYDRGGTPFVQLTGIDLNDPTKFSVATLFDNNSLATSEQWAWRGDVQYDLDGGFLSNFKFGARYTHRRVEQQATASEPFPIGTPVLLSSVPNLASTSPDGLVKGRLGIDTFQTASTDFLLNNTDALRTLFGRAPGDRAFDPALSFFDTENTYAFYGQAGFRFDVGGVPVTGTGGVRVVNTVQDLEGAGVTGRQNYLNLLPSINARAELTSKLILRGSAGKTLTRPEFASLNPLVSYTSNGNTGGASTAFTGGGGNAALRPQKTDAYDLTLEWYFSRTGSITAAGFYKNLDGYIQTYSAVEPYLGQTALVSRPRNTENGKLKGVELAYQQFFDFLPGALSGFGAQLNGTYIEGMVDDPINGGRQRLVNVSKYSYNAIAIYEKYGLSARLAYNWRSNFVAGYNSGGVQAGTVLAQPTGQLDFSGSYALTDAFTLTLDATNITDRTYHDRFDGINSVSGLRFDTPRDTRTYDRTIQVGARFKF